MATAEATYVNNACKEAAIRVRDVEVKFRYMEGRLKVVSRMNFSGGKSTGLSASEYAEALTLAAQSLGIRIKLRRAA
ncbi:MAG TPA: hypothetical protein VMV71_01970 [Candidatus Paceibacterota bacterium]|nr:hypothetical protein [Candidatus Paceibacterota bacterium]